jgi:hypothetical protein
LATGPNQVSSWDITKLKAAERWSYYYLYVLLDIFSRYVVGWLLAHQESAELAEQLIVESYNKQGVEPGQVTVHADHGPACTAKTVKQMTVDLGITSSHGRPRVSNDNSFSESHFKTMKYQPEYPNASTDSSRRTASAGSSSRATAGSTLIRGSRCELLGRRDGLACKVLVDRQRVLDAAYAAHPERFVNGGPSVPAPLDAVWINPAEDRTQTEMETHEARLMNVSKSLTRTAVPSGSGTGSAIGTDKAATQDVPVSPYFQFPVLNTIFPPLETRGKGSSVVSTFAPPRSLLMSGSLFWRESTSERYQATERSNTL